MTGTEKANEAGRSGGEYPRAIDSILQVRYCDCHPGPGHRRDRIEMLRVLCLAIARSGAIGTLQQFTSLTGAPVRTFAPQHSVVEQAITDGTLMLSGRSTATIKMAIKRTLDTLLLPSGRGNESSVIGSNRFSLAAIAARSSRFDRNLYF